MKNVLMIVVCLFSFASFGTQVIIHTVSSNIVYNVKDVKVAVSENGYETFKKVDLVEIEFQDLDEDAKETKATIQFEMTVTSGNRYYKNSAYCRAQDDRVLTQNEVIDKIMTEELPIRFLVTRNLYYAIWKTKDKGDNIL